MIAKSFRYTHTFFFLFWLFTAFSSEGIALHACFPILRDTPEDSLRALMLNEKAEKFLSEKKPDSTIFYANKSLEISESALAKKYTAHSYLLVARAFRQKSQHGSALKYLMKCAKMRENLPSSPTKLMEVYTDLGELYLSWGLPKSALEYYIKTKDLLELTNNDELLLEVLPTISEIYLSSDNIGKVISIDLQLIALNKSLDLHEKNLPIYRRIGKSYATLEAYDKALNYSFIYLENAQKWQNMHATAMAFNDIGNHYKQLEDYKRALNYFIQYLIQCKKHGLQDGNISLYKETLLTIGIIYQEWGEEGAINYTHALNYFDKKLKIDELQGDKKEMARTCNLISGIYLKLGDFKEARLYGEQALNIGMESNSLEVVKESYFHLYKAHIERSNFKKGLMYFERYELLQKQLHDKALEEQRQLLLEQIAEKRMQFITNKREQMIIDEELNKLAFKQLELESEKQQQELQLLTVDTELQKAELRNEQLEKDRALQELILLQRQYETVRQDKVISLLRKDREIQELTIKQQELEQEQNKKAIELLEKEKDIQQLTIGKQKVLYFYSKGITALVSIILLLILISYLNSRNANRKLAKQKEQIALQAEKIESAYHNLEMLSVIGQEITASLSVEKITDTVYENVNALMDAAVFGIGIFNESKQALEFLNVREKGKTLPPFAISITDDSRLATVCFQQKQPLFIKDFHQEYREYVANPEPLPREGDQNAVSIIYMPLIIQGNVKGVLTVQSFQQEAYSEYHLNMLRNIAIYVKIALENAGSYMELAEKSQNLKEANQSIIKQKELIEDKNKALTDLNLEKNHLIGIVAHDLRNPLSIAIGLTDFLLHQVNNFNKQQADGLKITHKSLKRMDFMIKQILDVRAIESGDLNVQLEKVDLREVLSNVTAGFIETLDKKNLTVHQNYQTNESVAELDRNYAVQVFENLISNALKFSEPGTSIHIKVSDREDKLRIEVQDQGPGIGRDDAKYLFKKFQRLSARPTAGEQSVGLGLSIVKKYVEAMDGKVWCESELGKGANFIVEFNKTIIPV